MEKRKSRTRRDSKEGGWTCAVCGEFFRTRALLKEHKKNLNHNSYNNTHISKELYCKFCGLKKTTTTEGMSNHERYCAKNPNRKEGNWKGRTHTEYTRQKWKNNPNMGGLRPGSGRGKKGWYKDFYCRSTWELAWLAYQLENGNKVEKCSEHFEYFIENKAHRYYPDFVLNGTYIEIKGWRLPNVEQKISQFPKDKKLLLIEGKREIKPYLDYVLSKYGKDFHEVLYEKKDKRGADEKKFH